MLATPKEVFCPASPPGATVALPLTGVPRSVTSRRRPGPTLPGTGLVFRPRCPPLATGGQSVGAGGCKPVRLVQSTAKFRVPLPLACTVRARTRVSTERGQAPRRGARGPPAPATESHAPFPILLLRTRTPPLDLDGGRRGGDLLDPRAGTDAGGLPGKRLLRGVALSAGVHPGPAHRRDPGAAGPAQAPRSRWRWGSPQPTCWCS